MSDHQPARDETALKLRPDGLPPPAPPAGENSSLNQTSARAQTNRRSTVSGLGVKPKAAWISRAPPAMRMAGADPHWSKTTTKLSRGEGDQSGLRSRLARKRATSWLPSWGEVQDIQVSRRPDPARALHAARRAFPTPHGALVVPAPQVPATQKPWHQRPTGIRLAAAALESSKISLNSRGLPPAAPLPRRSGPPRQAVDHTGVQPRAAPRRQRLAAAPLIQYPQQRRATRDAGGFILGWTQWHASMESLPMPLGCPPPIQMAATGAR